MKTNRKLALAVAAAATMTPMAAVATATSANAATTTTATAYLLPDSVLGLNRSATDPGPLANAMLSNYGIGYAGDTFTCPGGSAVSSIEMLPTSVLDKNYFYLTGLTGGGILYDQTWDQVSARISAHQIISSAWGYLGTNKVNVPLTTTTFAKNALYKVTCTTDATSGRTSVVNNRGTTTTTTTPPKTTTGGGTNTVPANPPTTTPTKPTTPTTKTITFNAVRTDWKTSTLTQIARANSIASDRKYFYREDVAWNRSTNKIYLATLWPITTHTPTTKLSVTVPYNATAAQILATQKAKASSWAGVVTDTRSPALAGKTMRTAWIIPTGAWDSTADWHKASTYAPQIFAGQKTL